jgi:glycosyltransferase involved in cell wall biosynthesis
MEPLNLHFAGTGSWGVMGRSMSRSLSRCFNVALVDPPVEECVVTKKCAEFSGKGPPVDPDAVTLNFGDWRKSSALPGRKVVSYIAWETTRVPEPILNGLRSLAEIWVPSHWQRRIFIRNGLDRAKVCVVPLGYDPELFKVADKPREPGRPYRFLFVGKWEERKGVRELLEAFTGEFRSEEPVELVMAAHNPFLANFDAGRALSEELIRLRAEGARITLVAPMSEVALVKLYQSADAFVLPTRAEGWGLPLLEAMACGLPCIVTNYSAPTEFAEADTVYFLRRRLWLKRVNDPVFYDQKQNWGRWACPSVSHLRSLLRRLASDPEAAREKGREAARRVRERWTWDHAAIKGAKELRETKDTGEGLR